MQKNNVKKKICKGLITHENNNAIFGAHRIFFCYKFKLTEVY